MSDDLVSIYVQYSVSLCDFPLLSMVCFSLKRSRKFQPEDRLFSLSSVTSPAVCYIACSYSMMVLHMSLVL